MTDCKAKYVTYYTVITPGWPLSVGEEYSITERCQVSEDHGNTHQHSDHTWTGGETTTEYREFRRPVYVYQGPFRDRIN